jgi:hypothetical protein
MTISDIYKVLDLHFSRAERAAYEIHHIHLDVRNFSDFEAIKTIDTFIYRFSKIQDYMGEKLFPAVLQELGEYKSAMPFKDVLNKLERLEIISSAMSWMEYREIRNTLTHEYPDNEKEIIEGIRLGLEAFQHINEIYNNIKLRYQ